MTPRRVPMDWRFWLVTLAAVASVAATASLGRWQLDRAAQKQARDFGEGWPGDPANENLTLWTAIALAAGVGRDLEASSAYLTAVGTLPFTEKFSGYAKAGFQRWDLDTGVPAVTGTGDDSGDGGAGKTGGGRGWHGVLASSISQCTRLPAAQAAQRTG